MLGIMDWALTNSQHLQQYLKDERVEARSQTRMEQAKNKTTVNPKYNGKDRHLLQQYLKDKRDKARFQTLREQAENKTTVNPKNNGKDSHLRQQYLKDTGRSNKRAWERG